VKKRKAKTSPAAVHKEHTGDLFDNIWLVGGVMLLLAVVLFNKGLLSSHMLYGTDFVAGEYMKRSFVAHVMNSLRQIPLWYPDVYGGLPYVDAVAGDLFYPTSLIMRTFLPVHQMSAWTYFIHILGAGLGTYLFLRYLRIRGTAAFLSGISYMFTGSMVSLVFAGHDGKVIVSSLLPWMLLFLGKTVDAQKWPKWLLWSLCSSLVIGLALLSPHVQMTYYLLLSGLFFAAARLYLLYRSGQSANRVIWRGIARGSILLLLGFSLYAIQALPLLNYMKFSPRGEDKGYKFATSYSMPPEEIINTVWPEFSGMVDKKSDQGPTHWYWGRRDLKLHTEFIGAITILFAVIGWGNSRRRKLKMFFLFLGLFALLVAFGGFTPLYYLVYYLIPGMSKFRSPAMIFNTFAFSVTILSALGIQSLAEDQENRKMKKWVFISLGVFLLLGIIISAAQDAVTSALTVFSAKGWGPRALWQSYPEMRSGFWVFFLFLASGCILALLLDRKTISLKWWAFIAAAFIFIELGRVDLKYLKITDPPSVYFAGDEVVKSLEKDRGLYRVWPVQVHQQGSYLTLFGIQLTGGEHPNPLKRYNEYLGTSPKAIFPDYHNLLQYPAYGDILGVKYLLLQQPLKHPNFSLYDTCYGGQVKIFRNDKAFPRAWLAGEYEVIKNDQMILERIRQSDFDPASTVILEEEPQGYSPQKSTRGVVSIEEYQPNRVRMALNAESPGLLVTSDNYYPAWKAFIDGQETKVYRADYTFRAIAVPAGRHQVEFKYHSRVFETGKAISVITAFLVIGGIIALGITGAMPNRKKELA
jgi:hypothetical protein